LRANDKQQTTNSDWGEPLQTSIASQVHVRPIWTEFNAPSKRFCKQNFKNTYVFHSTNQSEKVIACQTSMSKLLWDAKRLPNLRADVSTVLSVFNKYLVLGKKRGYTTCDRPLMHLIGVPKMRITTTLAAAAAIAVTGAAASAGGLAPEVMEAPVVIVDTPMAPTGSVNSGYIVLGLLAALVAASGSY
jgi:hypothetical protein